MGIGRLKHHVLLCAGAACCDAKVGARAWGTLKRTTAALELRGDCKVFATKCECLKMCDRGPIAVVYPEGIWYERVDAKTMERIIDEHVVGGEPVEEHVFARDSLGRGSASHRVAGDEPEAP